MYNLIFQGRYSSFDKGIGAKIEKGLASLEELEVIHSFFILPLGGVGCGGCECGCGVGTESLRVSFFSTRIWSGSRVLFLCNQVCLRASF